jgi:hypothetical protein
VTPRRYALRPSLIRALIPEHVLGTYVLWSPSAPVYVGRSDTSLRRRLLEHARTWPDIYFTYDVAFSAEDAYTLECSLFHALGEHTSNVDHPQRADTDHPPCPFCIETIGTVRGSRLLLRPTG